VGNITQAPREKGQDEHRQDEHRQETTVAPPPRVLTNTNVVPMPTPDEKKEHESVPVRRKAVK
jgi:hypothetical protein